MQYFLQKLTEKSIENISATIVLAIFLRHSFTSIRNKNYLTAAVTLITGAVLGIFSGGIISWLSGIGGDSLVESRNFDRQEAIFWLSTFFTLLPQMALATKSLWLVFAQSIALSYALIFITRRWKRAEKILNATPIAAIICIGYIAYLGFSTQQKYIESIQSSFDPNPTGFSKQSDVDLFVYIGESTTSLNMEIYGYPLPTTPRLQEIKNTDPGFLLFDKVRATHTHTSESLLRALSLTSDSPGHDQRRWGISSILKNARAQTSFYSIQPLTGSFSSFSRFIFGSFDYHIAEQDRYKGNLVAPAQKDHQLLETALKDRGIVFFHSYAGHGNYLDLIDKELSNPVRSPNINFDGIYGSGIPKFMRNEFTRSVEEYNRTLTYIDRNVSTAIKNIAAKDKPAALIYFSDHGESAYTRRGHESSQFINEMSTVPVLFYFNKAYREKFPQIFDRYQKSATSNQTRFLDQIPASLLEIADIHSDRKIGAPSFTSKEEHPHPIILERETLSGKSRINFKYDKLTGFVDDFFGGYPEPTYISILNEYLDKKNTLCYHRSDSYAKALRAASVAKCIEFDLVVEGDSLNVHHPPAAETGFNIEHIFQIAQARHNSLWIDAKNIDDPASCDKLASYLEKEHHRVGTILVEFPPNSKDRLSELRSCAQRLHEIGAKTSYYVPTELAEICSKKTNPDNAACASLFKELDAAISSGIFTDLSFDFAYYLAIKKFQPAKALHWNTWAIQPKNFHKIPSGDFDFIIMETSSDPNTY